MVKIPAIVLAGGRSSRMGRPKALLPTGRSGETFFDRLTQTLLDGGAAGVVVVVGADADAICDAARPRPGVRIVRNPDYPRGQLTSLVAGLAAIADTDPPAAIVTLIDVPFVSPATVRLLLDAHAAHGSAIVRPVRNGEHGHPVIFDRALFAELRAADPEVGAKAVVRRHAADILDVAAEDDGAFIDIDTPEEYARHVRNATNPL